MIPVDSVASIVRPGGATMVGRGTSSALARTGVQGTLQQLLCAYTAHGGHPRHSCVVTATPGRLVTGQSRRV
jgi:hypothetical protein